MRIVSRWMFICTIAVIPLGNAYSQIIRASLPVEEVVKLADAHIEEIVGEEYFKQNYYLDNECSRPRYLGAKGNERNEYTICYIYLPALKLANDNNHTRIKLRFLHRWQRGADREIIFEPIEGPYGFVVQKQNAEIVEPSIDLPRAIRIAESEFGQSFEARPNIYLTTNSLFDYQFADTRDYTDEWVYILRYHLSNAIKEGRRCVQFALMRVNAIDGAFRRLDDEEGCSQVRRTRAADSR